MNKVKDVYGDGSLIILAAGSPAYVWGLGKKVERASVILQECYSYVDRHQVVKVRDRSVLERLCALSPRVSMHGSNHPMYIDGMTAEDFVYLKMLLD